MCTSILSGHPTTEEGIRAFFMDLSLQAQSGLDEVEKVEKLFKAVRARLGKVTSLFSGNRDMTKTHFRFRKTYMPAPSLLSKRASSRSSFHVWRHPRPHM